MKNFIFLVFTSLILFSCQDRTETKATVIAEQPDEATALLGTWEMVGFYNYRDNMVTDSFKTREGYRQVKMYTAKKVMWSKLVPSDSSEWFGYGSYFIKDSVLTEVLDFGSKMMNEVISEKKQFKYKLVLEKDKFSQVEIDDDGNLIYAENYVRIE